MLIRNMTASILVKTRYVVYATKTRYMIYSIKTRYVKVKADVAVPQLRAMGRHLPYGITQCYLPPDTSECAPPNPGHAGRYSFYLTRRDGKLS